MGFKTQNYKIEELNITIPEAYAKISNLTITDKGTAYALFHIQQDRESAENLDSLEVISYACSINKNQLAHEQVYLQAKKDLFADWEDDIIEELKLGGNEQWD